MHILITNDDGIFAPGLHTLARVTAQAGHSVVVVAPATQQSATGHRLTITAPLMVERLELDPGYETYSITGTPVDCARLGRRLSKQPFDFCLSGINDGLNVGTSLYYSGTAAAAREAAMLYLPSMAISIDLGADEDMRIAVAEQALAIMDYLIKHPMPRLTFCNLNAPSLPRNEMKPVRLTSISESFWLDEYQEQMNPRGQTYFWLYEGEVKEKPQQGTDEQMVQAGYLAVSFVGNFMDNNKLYSPQLEKALEH